MKLPFDLFISFFRWSISAFSALSNYGFIPFRRPIFHLGSDVSWWHIWEKTNVLTEGQSSQRRREAHKSQIS